VLGYKKSGQGYSHVDGSLNREEGSEEEARKK
jgi:hypothetical protein